MTDKPQPIILTRITPEQLPEYEGKVDKIAYLCDGKACKRNCKEVGFGQCIRTGNENNAINKGHYNGFELSRYYDYYVLEELENEPVNHWIPFDDKPRSIKFICSHCNKTVYSGQLGNPTKNLPLKNCTYPYCPYCREAMEPYIQISEVKK